MQLNTESISPPGSRTFLCDLPFPARTTELRYKCLLFPSSWVLLFSLSLAFILCPAGCSSLFIYWLFSMEKHPVFQHWQQILVMSLPITLHWVSSLPVRLLAGFLLHLTYPQSLRILTVGCYFPILINTCQIFCHASLYSWQLLGQFLVLITESLEGELRKWLASSFLVLAMDSD